MDFRLSRKSIFISIIPKGYHKEIHHFPVRENITGSCDFFRNSHFGSQRAGEGIALDKGGGCVKERKIGIHWRAALLGLGISVVVMTALTALGAWLMVRGIVSMEWMAYWAAGILVISSLVGGVAARLGGSAADSAVAAAGELVVLLGLNGVLCGGQMEGLAATALALAGGSGAAMFLGVNRGRGRKRRRRR